MSLVSKWSLWSEQSSPGCSTVVIRAEQQADIHTNILNTLLGLKIRLQKCWSIVNGNCVTVTYSMMMDGNRLFYWSTPAALLVRFRGDVLGDALSVRQDVKSAVCVASFIYKQKITFHITEKKKGFPVLLLVTVGDKMNILMTLRVSWGIQLMSTSFTPTVPFSIFTESLFFCKINTSHV